MMSAEVKKFAIMLIGKVHGVSVRTTVMAGNFGESVVEIQKSKEEKEKGHEDNEFVQTYLESSLVVSHKRDSTRPPHTHNQNENQRVLRVKACLVTRAIFSPHPCSCHRHLAANDHFVGTSRKEASL
ncbi:hypothetical protein VNO80_09484 [Phaseolus coccineus]|uniref:Uncharacterized protein n=1 Tax=Phaseolus coccineus TaxID=3886 RepID=A0AAN9RCR5_PHACN